VANIWYIVTFSNETIFFLHLRFGENRQIVRNKLLLIIAGRSTWFYISEQCVIRSTTGRKQAPEGQANYWSLGIWMLFCRCVARIIARLRVRHTYNTDWEEKLGPGVTGRSVMHRSGRRSACGMFPGDLGEDWLLSDQLSVETDWIGDRDRTKKRTDLMLTKNMEKVLY